MTSFLASVLLMAPPPTNGGAPNPLATFLPFILIFVIFYFFIIRPQQKRQKEKQKMLEALQKGDKVVTIGGIHGRVVSVDGDTVLLEVDEDTKIRFDKNAIAAVLAKKE